VLAAARAHGVQRVLGMRSGIEGLLAGEFVDLFGQSACSFERLRWTPSAALGSCRYRLKSDDLDRALTLLRQENARQLIYIGGNDSADTSHQVHQAAHEAGYELMVIGVPKTIDNDLPITDHSPGYGSAARYVAQSTAEAGLDTASMQRTDPIKLIEVMGRHAGWLAAASWLGKTGDDRAPHLVYLPERPERLETILSEVEAIYRQIGHCVVVLCENQPDPAGGVLGAGGEPRWVDDFGHQYFDSPAQHLAYQIRRQLGVRARVDKPGTLQRTSAAHVSATDLIEAELVGSVAVSLALAGRSDVMVTLVRVSDEPYRCVAGEAPLAAIANHQRTIPDEFIETDQRGLTEAFVRYAGPLIGGPLPEYARLG
jgi:ATP-dependent phosphofructokinase / diphosphate-dependent phosphofructokinase